MIIEVVLGQIRENSHIECNIIDPKIPVVGNVEAKALTTAEELRADIKAQMQSRVRWTESVQEMVKTGINTFVEVGSGNVLLGLIRRIASGTLGYTSGKPEDFSALM